MHYDKRIRYLSYYESGIRIQNAGYVKFQVREGLCQMVIQVKGPRLMGSGEAAVYLLAGRQDGAEEDGFPAEAEGRARKHLIGNVSLHNGQGYCAARMDAANMADSGLRYDEICGIRIEVRERQYLESRWSAAGLMEDCADAPIARMPECAESEDDAQKRHAPMEISLMVTPVSERSRCVPEAEDETGQGVVFEEQMPVAKECQPVADVRQPPEDAAQQQETEIWERTPEKWEAEAPSQKERKWETGTADENGFSENDLYPDKWGQLRKTYPIVHPIREDEEYLKIAPKDFVIFTEKYQELVHNSFLLHGYYNYRHLIFGKKERDGKAAYYLGVPGTFHDREKSVAVMFGFEAFDGKREPAENGDFGYYLKRVEI